MSTPVRSRLSVGFSLFEVLVVLVIVGMVTAVTLSILTQLRQTVERFYPTAEQHSRRLVRGHQLATLFGSFLPSRTPALHFRGSPNELTALASYVPHQPWPVEMLTRVRLVAAAETTIVRAEQLADNGQAIGTVDILELACTKATFSYLDGTLRWLDGWTQRADYPHLPLAILLSCGIGRDPVYLVTALEREGRAAMTNSRLIEVVPRP